MKKQAGRLRKCMISTVLLLCVCLAAFAKEYTYTLSDLGMSICVPEEFVVLTRDLKEDDAVFALIGMDHATAMQTMQINDLYMDGVHGESGLQITIHMYESEHSKDVGNFSEISEDERQQYMQAFLQTTAALGQMQQIGEFSTLEADGALFYDGTFLVDAQGMQQNMRIFNTVKDNQNILITFYKNLQEFTEEDQAMMEQIVGSIVFSPVQSDNASSVPQSASASQAASSQGSAQEETLWAAYGVWIILACTAVVIAVAVAAVLVQKRKNKL